MVKLSAPSRSKKRVLIIKFDGGAKLTRSANTYVTVGGRKLAFNPDNYDKVESIKFCVNAYMASGAGNGAVILRDVTNGSDISDSELIISSESNANVQRSNDLKDVLSKSDTLYGFRHKGDGTKNINTEGVWLEVTQKE